jgi:hypothetical protein
MPVNKLRQKQGAVAEPLQVPGIPLILGRRSVMGWPSGTSIDSQDTLNFSLLTGVRAMSEVFRSSVRPRRTST